MLENRKNFRLRRGASGRRAQVVTSLFAVTPDTLTVDGPHGARQRGGGGAAAAAGRAWVMGGTVLDEDGIPQDTATLEFLTFFCDFCFSRVSGKRYTYTNMNLQYDIPRSSLFLLINSFSWVAPHDTPTHTIY